MSNRSRVFARWFAFVLMSVIALDVAPWFPFLRYPKRCLSVVLNRIGLWQGDWPLFAPNPVLNNGWISAEIVDEAGNRAQWNSPYWQSVGVWEKFYRFREMNFYNRVVQERNVLALDDFADFVARTNPVKPDGKTTEIDLYRNEKRMVLPEDEPLPAREETMWMSMSKPLNHRTYRP